jgi:hypothetical protein
VGTFNYHPVAIVLFVSFWLGALVWIGVSGLLRGQAAEAIIRETPEYRCIAAASGEKPRLRWSTLKNLRFVNTAFAVGTLIEKGGADCIENGEATSFALLPEGPGEALSLVRINGREVRPDFRGEGQWADVTDATGTERWRNDGNGYRRISP